MASEPAALARRPHYGKLPIPWITYVAPDGTPDFRVHVEMNRRLVETERRCQLCGERMGEEVTFIGFPTALQGMRFGEPPAHRECLDYALEVCPWLSGRPRSGRDYGEGVSVGHATDGPQDLIIYTCEDFTTGPDPSGETELVYLAGWATRGVEYYRRPMKVLT